MFETQETIKYIHNSIKGKNNYFHVKMLKLIKFRYYKMRVILDL